MGWNQPHPKPQVQQRSSAVRLRGFGIEPSGLRSRMGLIPAHRFCMSFTGLMQRLAIAANRRPSQAENHSAQLALAVNPA